MKLAILSAAALLGACDPPLMDVPPVPVGQCTADPAKALTGRKYAAALGRRAMQVTGARNIRVIHPGQAVTMDYRTDRLNVRVDGSDRITGFSCG